MTKSANGRFRWAVLGPGMVATRAVMPAIASSTNGVLAVVASRDRARAEAASRPYGGVRCYGEYAAALADPAVDGIYLALPNHLHAEWTIRAAEAGKHVLCEKPLALTAAEAAQMVAACRQAGVLLMEAVMARFHPRNRHLAVLVGAGAIGALRGLEAAFTFPLQTPETYRLVPEYGGGALLDVGCYGVHFARWLLGGEPVAVAAFARQAAIDWATTALLQFPAGQVAQLVAAFDAAEHQRLTLLGSEGTLVLERPFTAWRDEETTILLRSPRGRETLAFPPTDPYRLMVEQFVAAARGEEPPLLPAEDGLHTARVLEAIRVAATQSRVVALGAGE